MNDADALGTDTLGRVFVNVPARQFMAMTQRAHTHTDEQSKPDLPFSVKFGRILCWVLAGGFALTSAILTGFHWSGAWHPPTGVITWLSLGVTLSFMGALAIQGNINQQQILATAEEAVVHLRAEIRGNAPADAIELARIATLVKQVAATQTRLAERLDAIEAIARSLADPASNFTQYLAACDDLRRNQGDGVG